MKLHERVMPTQKLRSDIECAILDVIGKHPEATILELLSCLNQTMQSWIGSGIRDERHPDDPEKRGGEA